MMLSDEELLKLCDAVITHCPMSAAITVASALKDRLTKPVEPTTTAVQDDAEVVEIEKLLDRPAAHLVNANTWREHCKTLISKLRASPAPAVTKERPYETVDGELFDTAYKHIKSAIDGANKDGVIWLNRHIAQNLLKHLADVQHYVRGKNSEASGLLGGVPADAEQRLYQVLYDEDMFDGSVLGENWARRLAKTMLAALTAPPQPRL